MSQTDQRGEPVRAPHPGRPGRAAEPEVAGVPAGGAAALGRRDGHGPGRAGPRRDHHRGPARRGRLPVGSCLSAGTGVVRARRLGLVAGSRHRAPHRRRDDRDGARRAAGHPARRCAGADDTGLPALPGSPGDRRVRGTSRPPGRERATRSRCPGDRVRRDPRGGWVRDPGAVQSPQPHRGGPHPIRARGARRAHRGPRRARRRRRDPRAAGPSGGDVHPLPDGGRRRTGVRGALGLEGVQPARTQGGPDRARAGGRRRDHRRTARDPGPQRQLDRRAGPRGRAGRRARLARRAPRRPDLEPCAARRAAGHRAAGGPLAAAGGDLSRVVGLPGPRAG